MKDCFPQLATNSLMGFATALALTSGPAAVTRIPQSTTLESIVTFEHACKDDSFMAADAHQAARTASAAAPAKAPLPTSSSLGGFTFPQPSPAPAATSSSAAVASTSPVASNTHALPPTDVATPRSQPLGDPTITTTTTTTTALSAPYLPPDLQPLVPASTAAYWQGVRQAASEGRLHATLYVSAKAWPRVGPTIAAMVGTAGTGPAGLVRFALVPLGDDYLTRARVHASWAASQDKTRTHPQSGTGEDAASRLFGPDVALAAAAFGPDPSSSSLRSPGVASPCSGRLLEACPAMVVRGGGVAGGGGGSGTYGTMLRDPTAPLGEISPAWRMRQDLDEHVRRHLEVTAAVGQLRQERADTANQQPSSRLALGPSDTTGNSASGPDLPGYGYDCDDRGDGAECGAEFTQVLGDLGGEQLASASWEEVFAGAVVKAMLAALAARAQQGPAGQRQHQCRLTMESTGAAPAGMQLTYSI